jgi:hypothetical protein
MPTGLESKNTRNITTEYLKTRSAEKVFYATLPGYLIGMLEKTGPLQEQAIKYYLDSSGDYSKLRRSNGTFYTSDPVRAVRGALHSLNIFFSEIQINDGVYIVPEQRNMLKVKLTE